MNRSLALLTLAAACGAQAPADDTVAYVGAHVIAVPGEQEIRDATMLVRNGLIEQLGSASDVVVPEGAERIDLSGRVVVPGLVNAHGHVGGTLGLESGHYSEKNVRRQLKLYARYGITTVLSLGGDDDAGVRVRDSQDTMRVGQTRLYVAGSVVTGDGVEAVKSAVDANVELGADFIKLRVDDNLGTATKMAPELYNAAIIRAHAHSLPVAAHVFYLADAKALLRSDVNLIAHSIRDTDIDQEIIDLLSVRRVCYVPTLVREVSTFVYEDTPAFFDDEFFLHEADDEVLNALRDPERQRSIRQNRSAQLYKQALVVASRNVKALSDAGVTIAFGTDTGPPGRFQGYFEHLELGLMAEAGLSPTQILRSATVDAARCIGLTNVGTLESGKWADFIVLRQDPTTDIQNMRTIESVFVGGVQVAN